MSQSDVRLAIPVSILTGYLGAGKTTLINRMLRDPRMEDVAIVVNEIGAVGVDHLLVEKADDGLIELSDGCVCCSVRGSLVDTLAELIEALDCGRIGALRHILIETTGLADPAPVLQAVIGHPLAGDRLTLGRVVTAVDARHGLATLDRHGESVRQIAAADCLILTKTDLAGDVAKRSGLLARIAQINPSAPVLKNARDEDIVEALFAPPRGLTTGENDFRITRPETGHNTHFHHDARIESFSLCHDEPVMPEALQEFLELARALHGKRLLRVKGLVWLCDEPDRPLVVQMVQGTLSPPTRLEGWNGNPRQTRIVVIADDLPAARIQDLFDAFIRRPSIDAPDREALLDNPLSLRGG